MSSLILRISKLINNNNDNEKSDVYWLKALVIYIVLIFLSPLTIYDLYYAYNDYSCVSSYVDIINVNLKQYLQVRWLLTGSFIFLIILFELICNEIFTPLEI